jgi:hypothetical protein
MSEGSWSEHALYVVITKFAHGSAMASVRVRLRGGEYYDVARLPWPAGAPTPQQLELFTATVVDELQTLVLSSCGVQGVLLPEGRPED